MKRVEAEETADIEIVENHPVPLVTHVNNIMHLTFPIVEVYINKQQMNNSDGLYVHKSKISNNFKGAILHCQVYDYEKTPCDNWDAP